MEIKSITAAPGISVYRSSKGDKKRYFIGPIEILEVGCGLGVGISKIAGHSESSRITAIDIDEECINFNKANFRLPNIKWVHRGWEDIDGNYEIIIVIDVIEHVKEYEPFLRKLTRLLRPQGTVFLSTPNKPLYRIKVSSENHFREWDSCAFSSLMKKYFSNVNILLKKGWVLAVVNNPIY